MLAIRPRFVLLALLATLLAGSSAGAGSRDRLVPIRADADPIATPPPTAKASRDSVYLLGGPGRLDGRFEDSSGWPNWQGWTHEDLTSTECMWRVSDFNAIDGGLSAWCGTYFGDDPGYGNLWNQNLVFTATAPDPGQPTTVHWTALVQYDVEPNYDYVRLETNRGGQWEDELVLTGQGLEEADITVTYQPLDYVGPAHDQIQLRFDVTSDTAYSDEDGIIDTDGACQVDDIVVSFDGIVVSSEDCEDGVLDDWECVTPAVGDFTALWTFLDDLDPCRDNHSPQVAFIDDGVVVPGTGGTSCTTWCYGPDGYIVNNAGGLIGPEAHLDNRVMSPVLTMPAGMQGLQMRADIYLHEELGALDVWPGVFACDWVRSTSDPVGEPIALQPWIPEFLTLYGGPYYQRFHFDLTGYLVEGAVEVQVALGANDYGYFWGWNGTDGTPAPYLDNVAVVAFPFDGPVIDVFANEHLANDSFPAAGDLDLVDLSRNSVRFDAMQDISSPNDGRIDPGDSLSIKARAVRAGATLTGPPVMHVAMRANPLFDAVRVLPEGFAQSGALVTGQVTGQQIDDHQDPPQPVPDRFAFDLPDTGFFYPGDVIHYFYEARDQVGGDVGVSFLPADTAGFTDFGDASWFYGYYVVHALPTLHFTTPGDQPRLLFWSDSLLRLPAWWTALRNLGLERGVDYDWYHTNLPWNGNTNGLGGRATSAVLAGYETLLYTSGNLSSSTLRPEDVQVLAAWFERGDKHALLSGDNLVGELASGDSDQLAFLNNYLGVDFLGPDTGAFGPQQLSPHVRTVDGNGFIARVDEWVAVGGCPSLATFDAIAPVGSTAAIAEFLGPDGSGSVYPFVAGVHHLHPSNGASVVLLPYDLTRIHSYPGWHSPDGEPAIAARTLILEDILWAFGLPVQGEPIAAPAADHLTVAVAPNPFNPRATIALVLPRDDEVSVKIYSLRGELVRTLLDGPLPAGRHELTWDGAATGGGAVASGVYFCETRTTGEREVTKLTVVR